MSTINNRRFSSPWWHIAILLLLCGGLGVSAWQKSGQFEYPYPLDDSYIHLAISESWVVHSIPSPEASQPAFSSSSPLYSLLLAGLTLVFGSWVYWPLAIGLSAGIGVTLIVFRFLTLSGVHRPGIWLWTILILGPVPLLMMLGMEHMLQVFLWALFFLSVKDVLDQTGKTTWSLIILAVAVSTIRYEGMFLIGATAVVCWVSGFRKQSIFIGISGFSGVVLIGALSWLNGGTFIPLSLLMKGHIPDMNISSLVLFGNEVLQRLYDHPFVFVILTISAVGWAAGDRVSYTGKRMSAILQLASWGQIVFAEIGGYRYEAWMVILHILLMAILSAPYLRHINSWMVLSMGWMVLPLAMRTAFFTTNYPVSVQNIFHQSIQTGKFIQLYLEGESIAIQDIGAASYLAEFKLTDLAGIGDPEINALFNEQAFNPKNVQKILIDRGVSYAIIQQAWMGWVIPETWIAVGCWTTPEAFIVPNAEVFFWAADSASADRLSDALIKYSPALPGRVLQSGPYMGTELPEVAFLP